VQVKRGGGWIDADPLLPDAKLGSKVAEVKQTLSSPGADNKLTALPADLIHAVDVRLVVERLENGRLAEASPLTITLRPAELQGKRLVLTHVPVAYRPGPNPNVLAHRKALAATVEFLPVIYVGGAGNFGSAVTDAGQLIANPNLDQTAGMGKAAGNAFGGLGGGLTGADQPPKPTSIWTAEWIELTVRVPGCAPRTIRREVFDLIGPAARTATTSIVGPKTTDADIRLDRALSLVGETDLIVFGAQPTPEFLASRFAKGLLRAKQRVLAVAAEKAANKTGKAKLSLDADPRRLALSPLWGVVTGRAAASPVGGDVYLASPNVFCLTRRMRVGADGALLNLWRTDLAVNDVAVRTGAADPFAVRVRQGVADSVIESQAVEMLARLTSTQRVQATASNSTVKLFDTANGAAPTVVLPGKASVPAAWPADARTRATRAISDGDALVAIATADRVGWWRVDPASGATIGVTGDGYHSAMSERELVEARVNALMDQPFNLTIEEMKGLSQKEFTTLICRGKGLSFNNGLLQVFQKACQLHELILAL
jgi:hypothetical protein